MRESPPTRRARRSTRAARARKATGGVWGFYSCGSSGNVYHFPRSPVLLLKVTYAEKSR